MRRELLRRLEKLETHRIAQERVVRLTKAERDAMCAKALAEGYKSFDPTRRPPPDVSLQQLQAAHEAFYRADS